MEKIPNDDASGGVPPTKKKESQGVTFDIEQGSRGTLLSTFSNPSDFRASIMTPSDGRALLAASGRPVPDKSPGATPAKIQPRHYNDHDDNAASKPGSIATEASVSVPVRSHFRTPGVSLTELPSCATSAALKWDLGPNGTAVKHSEGIVISAGETKQISGTLSSSIVNQERKTQPTLSFKTSTKIYAAPRRPARMLDLSGAPPFTLNRPPPSSAGKRKLGTIAPSHDPLIQAAAGDSLPKKSRRAQASPRGVLSPAAVRCKRQMRKEADSEYAFFLKTKTMQVNFTNGASADPALAPSALGAPNFNRLNSNIPCVAGSGFAPRPAATDNMAGSLRPHRQAEELFLPPPGHQGASQFLEQSSSTGVTVAAMSSPTSKGHNSHNKSTNQTGTVPLPFAIGVGQPEALLSPLGVCLSPRSAAVSRLIGPGRSVFGPVRSANDPPPTMLCQVVPDSEATATIATPPSATHSPLAGEAFHTPEEEEKPSSHGEFQTPAQSVDYSEFKTPAQF